MTTPLQNDPTRAGQLASPRYISASTPAVVYAVHTRGDAVEWFVVDTSAGPHDADTRYGRVVGQYAYADTALARAAQLRSPTVPEPRDPEVLWHRDGDDTARSIRLARYGSFPAGFLRLETLDSDDRWVDYDEADGI